MSRRARVGVCLALGVWMIIAPTWLAAQSLVVFTGRQGGTSDLYRLDPDSLKYDRLTSSPASEMEAAISPDGSRVVFVSDRGGARALYLISPRPPLPTGAG